MANLYTLNAREPINQKIYRVLRQGIVNCTIPPGYLLSEKEIAARFDVSRQPVREAFIKLSETGLVQIFPQRGTFVCKISVKLVIAGRFIREAVETAVVRRAALEASSDYLLRMEQTLHIQKLLTNSSDANAFLLMDDEFHRLIAQSVDCELAWKTIENIKAAMDRVRFLSLSGISPPEKLIEEHYEIYDAIKNRNADAAEKGIRRHLQGMVIFITSVIENNQDWFTDEPDSMM
jgi:DNA-binding GntR family transcriptional regulator